MKLPLTGGCQCGALRYEISEAPVATYLCHCTECQRVTGSAFSMAILVRDAAFHVARGEPQPIERSADSGRTVTRWHCPECASWICNGAIPGIGRSGPVRRVRPGTLDDRSWLRPTAHFWTRSKQPWFVLPSGDQAFETQPD
jgi:hypothetical protein